MLLINAIRRLFFGEERGIGQPPSKVPDNGEEEQNLPWNKSKIEKHVRSRYNVIKKIGQGATGSVFQVNRLDNKCVQAIKVIPKSLMERNLVPKLAIYNEVSVMTKMNHRNILGLQQFHEDKEFLIIESELCSGGDLAQLVEQTPAGLSEYHSLGLLQSVLNALEYMHIRGVSHRDVKLSNILLSNDECVKLADFGTVHVNTWNGDGTSKVVCGTAQYAAPEVMRANRYLPPLVDLWSCGIALFVMLTRTMPFGERWWDYMRGNVKQRHVSRALRHERLRCLSPKCRALLEGLLTVNPNERMTLAIAIRLCDTAIRMHDIAARKRNKPWWHIPKHYL